MGVGRSSSPTAEASATKPGEKAPAAATKAPAKAASASAGHEADAKFGPTYVIKDRIVNLADPGGRRYLRYSVAIEFEAHTEAALVPIAPEREGGFQLVAYVPDDDASYQPVTSGGKDPDKEFQAAIKKYVPAIEDVVTTVLSSKTYDEVRSVEGKDAAKREIKDRVQRVLGDDQHVTNVYFTDFVVQ
jgi:flagellar basal body-associated protein FliL